MREPRSGNPGASLQHYPVGVCAHAIDARSVTWFGVAHACDRSRLCRPIGEALRVRHVGAYTRRRL